ncbi:MAG: PDZ domain-containing protein [Melioribacteraceae bacterium]|nr:PDZ domain-containing protein [Melioribacteraceae bacterium]MCF8263802.1 PDZ domain-containing protein [Melioribacteraceae bacterium]MCF8432359.1 PDZ domain-containing protein [Melioribacteraceae bacterium]
MKKYKLATLVILLIAAGFTFSQSDFYFQIAKSIDLFGRVYKEIAVNYVDTIEPEKLMVEGIKGMLTSLDPYTNYISESQQKDLDVITKGKYGGIGATVGLRNDKITIVDVLEGYSAQRQGLLIGDRIIKVDDVELSKKNYDDLGKYLKGKPGSNVKVIVERDGELQNLIFDLVREEIVIKNLPYYGFVPVESNNVYLKLSSFSRTAGEEIKEALIELKNQKEIKSIVLDLRGNPGGLLEAAIDISQKFLKKNDLIVTVKGRDGNTRKEYFARQEPLAGDSKIIVLIDGGSASASEIVAGAIQDHDRGIILGTKSFGKGLVQTVVPLSMNSSLKITTAKYYTPSGRCIQKIDYSKDNEVIELADSILTDDFYTENKRLVHSAGGIEPDTVVTSGINEDLVSSLLAQGMFFKFVSKYYPQETIEADSDKWDNIYLEFKNYLIKEDFKLLNRESRLLAELIDEMKKDDYSEDILTSAVNLERQLEKNAEELIDGNQYYILSRLKEEIAARVNGRRGRVESALDGDQQFLTALKIFENDSTYNLLLNNQN